MLDGLKKNHSPTVKKMPCTIDLTEKRTSWGLDKGARKLKKAGGDLSQVVMYYPLRVGEYTVKRYKNNTK